MGRGFEPHPPHRERLAGSGAGAHCMGRSLRGYTPMETEGSAPVPRGIGGNVLAAGFFVGEPPERRFEWRAGVAAERAARADQRAIQLSTRRVYLAEGSVPTVQDVYAARTGAAIAGIHAVQAAILVQRAHVCAAQAHDRAAALAEQLRRPGNADAHRRAAAVEWAEASHPG